MLIVVPVITVGLWWLLGHTAFGDAVRAAATNSDLARMTGINPKMVSTGVWAIAGFLAHDGDLPHRHRPGVGRPRAHRARHAAARHGGRARSAAWCRSPAPCSARSLIGILDRVLFFNYTTETGLVQFVLFLAVLVLVARVSRNDTASSGESFQFAPRIAAVPERLRNIWWVKRLPQFVAVLALLAAVILPCCPTSRSVTRPGRSIIAFALCAVSVVVLTGWGGQLSLGQMAFAGLGALTAAALIRGPVGRTSAGTTPGSSTGASAASRSRGRCCSARRFASLVAVLVGIGALRVRGLLLAVSTLAFAIAAQVYLFNRPFFTAGVLDHRRSRAPTSVRSSSPTGTARTTTSCCSCSSSCCCSSGTSSAPASAA